MESTRGVTLRSPPTQPNLPTMAEAGQPDFVVTSWAAFILPKATPRDIVEKLSTALRGIARETSVQDRFQIAGARVLASAPEEVTALGQKERPMWQEMVRVSGAKLE